MSSLWRQALRRLVQLVIILVTFFYGICLIADSRFMAIDRIDIMYDVNQRAAEIARGSYPPLTDQERGVLYARLQSAAAVGYGFDKPLLARVQARVTRFVTKGLGEVHTSTSPEVFSVVRPGTGGTRYTVSRSVSDIVWHATVPTLLLFGGAFLAQIVIAFFLGLWCARRPGSVLDRSTTVAGFIGTCVPPIAAAGCVVSLFVVAWRIFPGEIWIYRWPSGLNDILPWLADFLSYYLLPFLTIVALGFGSWAIQFRNIVLDIQREDFAEAARARGIPERRVVYGHVARTASPPLVSAIMMGFATSFFSCFFVEPLFHWPGLGTLFWNAVKLDGDIVIYAVMALTGVLYIICSFLLELTYGFLDPRIRTSQRGAGF